MTFLINKSQIKNRKEIQMQILKKKVKIQKKEIPEMKFYRKKKTTIKKKTTPRRKDLFEIR